MKHRSKVLLAAGAVVGLAFGVLTAGLWLTAPQYHLTPETFAAIQMNMSERDVEMLIGGPPHDACDVCFCGLSGCEPGIQAEWFGDGQAVRVVFYKGGVVDKRLREVADPPSFGRPASRSLAGRLRGWLGLR